MRRRGGERGKENAQKPRNETEKMRGRRKGGGGEEGETREEPRCSGLARRGLRLLLLAALRQLGGVRRGIEIANAHYGYFPIEGRIPLSLSLSPRPRSLTTFLALSPSTLLPPLALFKLSPFHSLNIGSSSFSLFLFFSVSLFSSIARSLSRCSSSYRIFSYPLILPPMRFFSPSRALFFFLESFLSLSLSRKTETHAEKRRQSLSFPRVPFLPISVTFSLRT